LYAVVATATLDHNNIKQCPTLGGGNNFWPSSYSPRTRLLYIPSDSGCNELKIDPSLSNPAGIWKGGVQSAIERVEGDVIAFDPLAGEIKHKAHWPYAGHAGTVVTAGGLVFSAFADGTFAAFDDQTMELKWKVNMGAGFTAPPISFGVNGKQYVAIASGLSRISRGTLSKATEAAEMRNSTVLYVFTLD
jgi:alcohol dehydrogenase (cytochrome c)